MIGPLVARVQVGFQLPHRNLGLVAARRPGGKPPILGGNTERLLRFSRGEHYGQGESTIGPPGPVMLTVAVPIVLCTQYAVADRSCSEMPLPIDALICCSPATVAPA